MPGRVTERGVTGSAGLISSFVAEESESSGLKGLAAGAANAEGAAGAANAEGAEGAAGAETSGSEAANGLKALTPDVTLGVAISFLTDPKGLKGPAAGAGAETGSSFGSAFSGSAEANGLNTPACAAVLGAAVLGAAGLGEAAGFLASSGLNGLGVAGAAGAAGSDLVDSSGLNAPGRPVALVVAAPLGAATGFLGAIGLNGLGAEDAAGPAFGAPIGAKAPAGVFIGEFSEAAVSSFAAGTP